MNFVLDKLAAAGIEVVSHKSEFDRILERENILQKMEENEKDKKNALRYHTANILQLNRSIGQYNDNFFGQESQDNQKSMYDNTPKLECVNTNYLTNSFKCCII